RRITFRSRNPNRIPAVAFMRVDFPASLRPTIRLSFAGSSLTESPWLNWPNPSSLIWRNFISRPFLQRTSALLDEGAQSLRASIHRNDGDCRAVGRTLLGRRRHLGGGDHV